MRERLVSFARYFGAQLVRQNKNQAAKGARSVSAKNSPPAGSRSHFPAPSAPPLQWNIGKYGLPALRYTPDNDSLPDPGEIVWTWVPYEEMDGRGKDRPVLVVSMQEEYIFFVQMTSKDHAPGQLYQDEYERWWLDIGTGNWDSHGRPSEARLDLLWVVHQSQIRRVGGKLNREMYLLLTKALRKIHNVRS
ncbi:hypothetical protein J2S36_000475 [Arcanobacterium hippocoleae]|uniref:Type II toxin-antitoxin system PemK/MazF family toxin n=1 Tax=Arcanobacterium hippocoleae TaxID=149017 RepID=A0ABU1T0N8_9ACTO|nr:type II toxin-antitoxin system PemK/MazF family toxin [Arcanobacterium hippocoleae]MDR6938932.1 hypothetical protein [Arcanobacterium hippocoleae]